MKVALGVLAVNKQEITKQIQELKCREAHLIDGILELELEVKGNKKQLADIQEQINELEKLK